MSSFDPKKICYRFISRHPGEIKTIYYFPFTDTVVLPELGETIFKAALWLVRQVGIEPDDADGPPDRSKCHLFSFPNTYNSPFNNEIGTTV